MLKVWIMISFFLLMLQVPSFTAEGQSVTIQQTGINVIYNTTSLTLFPNETKAISANVTFDGNPVNDAFFYLDTVPDYDLGESSFLIAPGYYYIVFRNYSNSNIPPDSYSTNIVAVSE